MNYPFLVIGYQRSGTTLLRRLISMHPGMPSGITHESWDTLRQCSSKSEAIKKLKSPGKSSPEYGQKIPYLTAKQGMEIIKKYTELFEGTKILHITRYPEAVLSSQKRAFNADIDVNVKNYFDAVPKIHAYVDSIPGSMQVNYEQLVKKPLNYVSMIYNWMGEEVDLGIIHKIITTKNEWGLNGKYMYGLKYFDKIKPSPNKIILSDSIKKIIDSKRASMPKHLFTTRVVL